MRVVIVQIIVINEDLNQNKRTIVVYKQLFLEGREQLPTTPLTDNV